MTCPTCQALLEAAVRLAAAAHAPVQGRGVGPREAQGWGRLQQGAASLVAQALELGEACRDAH